MKKILSVFCIATLLFASCSDEYDDSKLWQNVNDLKDRIASLEKKVQTMNSDISSIQSIIDAINARDYIVKIEELADKSGYTITFAKGNTITIKHGKDGIDGKDSPIIGIDIYEGIYYWTITTNGNKTWLLDNDGNKLKVSGDDGIPPIIGIDTNGYWTIDMGNGVQRLKDANGEDVKAIGQDGTDGKDGVDGSSFFNNVRYDENFVYFTFTDGKTVSIPLSKGVSFTVSNVSDRQLFVYGETRTFDIVQNNIAKISISKPDGWKVSVLGDVMTVIAPPQENTFAEESGEIAITAMGTDSKSFVMFSFPVKIDMSSSDFKDVKFKEYILANFDKDGDGSISQSEANEITEIDCSGLGITSIAEIKNFPNLVSLNCSNNSITELDLTENLQLEILDCNSNQIIELDTSENTSLQTLSCYGNDLQLLDFSNCKDLTTLYLLENGKNAITDNSSSIEESYMVTIDKSSYNNLVLSFANTQILQLDCTNNESLQSIDIGKNDQLAIMRIESNPLLEILDVTKNSKLEILYCTNNKLSGLDVSQNPILSTLDCSGNEISLLDVMNNPQLTLLNCGNNRLSSISTINNTKLSILYCNDNQLTDLDISQNSQLTILDYSNGKFISSPTFNFPGECSGNTISSLNISNNPNLSQIYCSNNKIRELNLSECKNLMVLSCENNQLTKLDLSANSRLQQLTGYNNKIETLDFTHNTQLGGAIIHNNNLTNSIDVTMCNRNGFLIICMGNQNLQSVYMTRNQYQHTSNIYPDFLKFFDPHTTLYVDGYPVN